MSESEASSSCGDDGGVPYALYEDYEGGALLGSGGSVGELLLDVALRRYEERASSLGRCSVGVALDGVQAKFSSRPPAQGDDEATHVLSFEYEFERLPITSYAFADYVEEGESSIDGREVPWRLLESVSAKRARVGLELRGLGITRGNSRQVLEIIHGHLAIATAFALTHANTYIGTAPLDIDMVTIVEGTRSASRPVLAHSVTNAELDRDGSSRSRYRRRLGERDEYPFLESPTPTPRLSPGA